MVFSAYSFTLVRARTPCRSFSCLVIADPGLPPAQSCVRHAGEFELTLFAMLPLPIIFPPNTYALRYGQSCPSTDRESISLRLLFVFPTRSMQ